MMNKLILISVIFVFSGGYFTVKAIDLEIVLFGKRAPKTAAAQEMFQREWERWAEISAAESKLLSAALPQNQSQENNSFFKHPVWDKWEREALNEHPSIHPQGQGQKRPAVLSTATEEGAEKDFSRVQNKKSRSEFNFGTLEAFCKIAKSLLESEIATFNVNKEASQALKGALSNHKTTEEELNTCIKNRLNGGGSFVGYLKNAWIKNVSYGNSWISTLLSQASPAFMVDQLIDPVRKALYYARASDINGNEKDFFSLNLLEPGEATANFTEMLELVDNEIKENEKYKKDLEDHFLAEKQKYAGYAQAFSWVVPQEGDFSPWDLFQKNALLLLEDFLKKPMFSETLKDYVQYLLVDEGAESRHDVTIHQCLKANLCLPDDDKKKDYKDDETGLC